ncbi:MAG TPA: protoporphyrinogen oxidase HemJ [Rhizomicrobium sp.]|nr:protoporphyrinogen oxidase HemJ [Rhizomicrobium sp.]
MRDILADHYSWIMAAHVIAVISWMAGMLYLPRLFVYHCETPPGSEGSERFKVMERRLLKGIINPAMTVTWVLGLTLAWLSQAHLHPWFHAKFLAVLLLSGVHGMLVRSWRDFAHDRNIRSARYYRIINEVPAVLMVVIVVLVIVKPFT